MVPPTDSLVEPPRAIRLSWCRFSQALGEKKLQVADGDVNPVFVTSEQTAAQNAQEFAM
jgi:hypothetical protein